MQVSPTFEAIQQFVFRLGLTLFLAFFAMLIAPLFMIGVQQAAGYWRPVIHSVVRIISSLYLLLIVSIWWPARWVEFWTARLATNLQAMGIVAAVVVVPFTLYIAAVNVVHVIKVW